MTQFTGISHRTAGRIARQFTHRWGISIAIGAIILAISGLFGGLDTAQEKPAALDTAVDAGPWKVTITGARLTGELPPMYLSDKGNHWIVVLATVEITADRTWRYLREIVQLAPTDGIKNEPGRTLARQPVHFNDGVVLLRDATTIDQLNPGMPEKLAFFWELKADAPIPTEVKVYIGFKKFREDGLTSHMNWMDDSEHNQSVVVPVIDRRAAGATS